MSWSTYRLREKYKDNPEVLALCDVIGGLELDLYKQINNLEHRVTQHEDCIVHRVEKIYWRFKRELHRKIDRWRPLKHCFDCAGQGAISGGVFGDIICTSCGGNGKSKPWRNFVAPFRTIHRYYA
jgi:hypothetical protein